MFVELMDKRKKHILQSLELKRSEENHQLKLKRGIKYSFVPMDSEDVEGSKSQAEGSSKRTGEELESDNSKKQKIDENVEAEVDDEAEMKKHIKIVVDEEEHTAYERGVMGDLKVMFEPDAESEVWRNLQGYNVTVWKLFSSSGVHFVRFQNLHIFMLGRIVGIKRLHDDLGVNTAKVRVTAAKHNLVLLVILVKNMLSISAAGIKVNAAGYNC
ncbi:hypothetical protein Tco_0008160 [Tanacetum coccineum]